MVRLSPLASPQDGDLCACSGICGNYHGCCGSQVHCDVTPCHDCDCGCNHDDYGNDCDHDICCYCMSECNIHYGAMACVDVCATRTIVFGNA